MVHENEGDLGISRCMGVGDEWAQRIGGNATNAQRTTYKEVKKRDC